MEICSRWNGVLKNCPDPGKKGVWFAIQGTVSIFANLILYLNDEMYLINLSSIFFGLLLAEGLGQINSLHREGELLNFVLGKYHTPREVEHIFCFIDLKGSTTTAEKLGISNLPCF